MEVLGGGTTKAEEPSVTFVLRDETSCKSGRGPQSYSFSLSSSLDTVYCTLAKDAGYVEGTFSLIWKRRRGSVATAEDEEVIHQNSSATLFESNMEGRESLVMKDKDGSPPTRSGPEKSSNTTSSSSQGSKVTSAPLNNTKTTTGAGNYGNSYNYSNTSSSSYGYGNYGYNYSYKSETGYVGLVNQAMTCYLNSLLQTLYMTPEFRNALYQWKFTGTTGGEDGVKCIPYQLQRLFVHLQTSEKRAVETTDVTKSFGWDSSEAWQQHDVQELCRVMFDALEKRFKKDKHSEADLINLLYRGTLRDYVKCLKCGQESARDDHYLDIPLVIKPFGSTVAYGSVEEAMAAFVEPETLTGDNQYRCASCDDKCDAHKGLKFKSFPYLLTLQLKRFDFDYQTMHRIKLNDRMAFPRILDLNRFITDGDMPTVSEDVEELHRNFVVEEFEPQPPPYNYYGRHGNSSSGYSNAVGSSSYSSSTTFTTNTSRDNNQAVADSNNDDSRVADSNNEEGVQVDDQELPLTELTVGQRLKRGPYVYELFSIMIHSGSAIGGHYYAYIKSFADKRWYCFNDQSVSKLNEEDIEGTFGGPDSRSRGYYSSMYASSANAYMLMYRRVDRINNKHFLPLAKLPGHIKQQIEEDKKKEEEKRRQEEYERSLCKFRLFARHPVTGASLEKKIEVQDQWSLQDTISAAHKILGLEDVVSSTLCRLVRYDEYSECLDQSFQNDPEKEEEETFSHMVGGPRNYYSFELYLEIREENEVFKPYNKGGLNLKVLVVDVEAHKVASPVTMRAEQSWTVLELKTAVSTKFGLAVETMNVAVETYQNEGRHLSTDSHLLKNESLFKKHTVFVCSDEEDFKIQFRESEMNKLIEVYVNSILLYVTIPPPPPQPHPEPSPDVEANDRGDGGGDGGEGGEGAGGAGGGVGGGEGGAGEGGGEGAGGGVGGGEGGGEGEGGGAGGGAGGVGEGGGGEGDTAVQESSVDKPREDDEETTKSHDQETESKGLKLEPPEATPTTNQNTTSSSSPSSPSSPPVDMTKDRPLQRTIEVRIDRRKTLQNLKELLVDYVRQPVNNFKIYRLYSNNQEYEMSRLNDHLSTMPKETQLIVRLGRALLPGEVRVRLSLLRMDEPEFCKPLLDSIVTKGMKVRDFKTQLIKEAYNQGIEYPLQLDRIRLRKKTWKTASTIYLDHQVFDTDIHIFANFELYVEPLKGPEVMKAPDQMQVYLKQWRPSRYTVEPIHEIILDFNTTSHLRVRIAEATGIPLENVMFGKAHTSFPGELSVLDLEDELEWNPNVSNVSSMPLSIYDDGSVLYYKDSREKLAELTTEKRAEIQKNERSKSSSSHTGTSNYRYHAKEKALKIYTEEDDEEEEVEKEEEKEKNGEVVKEEEEERKTAENNEQ